MGISESTGQAAAARERAAGRRRAGVDASVIVVGGGPAGSILPRTWASRIDHVVLNHAVHRTAHVGESLTCSTTRVFGEIGFLDTLESGGS